VLSTINIEWLESKYMPEPNSGCWLWLGSLTTEGYGRWSRKCLMAHRISYELVHGPIPKDLEVDHLCRVHACVNPNHMEIVTRKENILRGTAPSARFAKATHCKHGHEFNLKNTYWRKHGGRACRRCQCLATRVYKERTRHERTHKH